MTSLLLKQNLLSTLFIPEIVDIILSFNTEVQYQIEHINYGSELLNQNFITWTGFYTKGIIWKNGIVVRFNPSYRETYRGFQYKTIEEIIEEIQLDEPVSSSYPQGSIVKELRDLISLTKSHHKILYM